MKNALFLAACLLLSGMSALAQGIVVNKTDGTKLYIPAEEVESITTYGYGEEPITPEPPTGATETFTANGVSFTMVKVDGGTFQMGSTTAASNEKPIHSVTLSSYYIGQTEVPRLCGLP